MATRRKLYGRRQGRPLRAGRRQLLDAVLPELEIALPEEERRLDPARLFDRPPAALFLEIGFGGGEHLVHRALEDPKTGFIGIEPFVNSMAKLLSKVDELGIRNIRLHDDDATVVLDWLPENSLDQIDLLYPDPWPKKKHWKRRFVSDVNLARFHRVLKPGGFFCFASDIDSYVNWTLQHATRHGGFEWVAQDARDWLTPFNNWPGTRYEAKARREGRSSAYLTFRRK